LLETAIEKRAKEMLGNEWREDAHYLFSVDDSDPNDIHVKVYEVVGPNTTTPGILEKSL
jgi:hypothetical protein